MYKNVMSKDIMLFNILLKIDAELYIIVFIHSIYTHTVYICVIYSIYTLARCVFSSIAADIQ